MLQTIKETPCVTTFRFGNPAFKTWMEKSRLLIQRAFEVFDEPIRHILTYYYLESFGSEQRIDYGTGHELNFFIFLNCLLNSKGLCDVEMGAFFDNLGRFELLHLISQRYFTLVRSLIVTYRLEPAGSHGAWGLDDYQFLPFMFGAAQMQHESSENCAPSYFEPMRPVDVIKTISNSEMYVVRRCIFLEAVYFVCQYKTGPFHEHSPLLFEICSIGGDSESPSKSWQRISAGFAKMYCTEVLDKFPIVQHISFSHLFPFE